jgi:serine/threonine protein kinase
LNPHSAIELRKCDGGLERGLNENTVSGEAAGALDSNGPSGKFLRVNIHHPNHTLILFAERFPPLEIPTSSASVGYTMRISLMRIPRPRGSAVRFSEGCSSRYIDQFTSSLVYLHGKHVIHKISLRIRP